MLRFHRLRIPVHPRGGLIRIMREGKIIRIYRKSYFLVQMRIAGISLKSYMDAGRVPLAPAMTFETALVDNQFAVLSISSHAGRPLRRIASAISLV
jgi:hypothetical protein